MFKFTTEMIKAEKFYTNVPIIKTKRDSAEAAIFISERSDKVIWLQVKLNEFMD